MTVTAFLQTSATRGSVVTVPPRQWLKPAAHQTAAARSSATAAGGRDRDAPQRFGGRMDIARLLQPGLEENAAAIEIELTSEERTDDGRTS
jgi:hypothetical protein